MRFLGILGIMLLVVSCRKDPGVFMPLVLDSIPSGDSSLAYGPSLPETPFDYESILYPAHFTNDPLLGLISGANSANPVTNEGATLGRVLFYDKNLSANNTVACASCHHQEHAFTDPSPFSTGFEGGSTTRNSMAISNTNYHRRFFWDVRANTIETQALMPIQHPVEMGMSLANLEYKLSHIGYYPELFKAAFGSSEVTADRIALAIGQFIKSMRTFQSKYDTGVAIGFTNYTAEESYGMDLFFNGTFRCNQCHNTQNFGGTDRQNNGLDAYFTDKGVALTTNKEEDIGKFKTPSLRNIELTAPYMHDGRFATLEEVLDFYSTNVHAHPNLDDRLTTTMTTGGPPLQFNFTDAEKAALISFLKTLTDYNFIQDIRYSNPFPN